MPSGTPGLNAFTGGLLMVMIAISLSRVSWTSSLISTVLSRLGIRCFREPNILIVSWRHCPIDEPNMRVLAEDWGFVMTDGKRKASRRRGNQMPFCDSLERASALSNSDEFGIEAQKRRP